MDDTLFALAAEFEFAGLLLFEFSHPVSVKPARIMRAEIARIEYRLPFTYVPACLTGRIAGKRSY
ncbi:MAG TPA: hypothetical protein VJQ56_05445 [Blastocatellia bacterium]|nr:hypothetical protein [Blastocatellia bacterium]